MKSARFRLNNCSLIEQFDNVQGGKMAAQYDQTAKERNLDFEKVFPQTERGLLLQLEQLHTLYFRAEGHHPLLQGWEK